MKRKIKTYFSSISRSVWILLLIVAVGVFLRTYQFHDWLHFGKDQARDAIITQSVARGESAWPLLGAAMGNTSFKIGPAYYYFQIISAKIFGQDPSVLAYPDLIFSILSIPLIYLFLSRYFIKNLALVLSGLYAISYFSIEYARFAWNPNPIPFFTILFLLSLYEFFIAEEKTKWGWIIAVGVALGVGVQLHAIIMVLLPAVLFFAFLFLMIKNRKVWNKVAVIFLIAVVLNLPQIINEINTGFDNSKLFLKSFAGTSAGENGNLPEKIKLNIACHVQANAHMLTSLGDKYNCNFIDIIDNRVVSQDFENSIWLVIASFLFSIFGYVTLVYHAKKNTDKKKRYFLGLIILYCLLYFPLLLPAIEGASHRYFIGTIFVPYIFLGFLIEFIAKINQKIAYQTMIILAVAFIAGTNIISIQAEAKQFDAKNRGDVEFAVLGELELMRDYIISNSQGQKEAVLSGGSMYLPRYAVALQYVAAEKNFIIIRGKSKNNSAQSGKLTFYIGKDAVPDSPKEIDGRVVQGFKNFGQLGIYKLQN